MEKTALTLKRENGWKALLMTPGGPLAGLAYIILMPFFGLFAIIYLVTRKALRAMRPAGHTLSAGGLGPTG